MAKIIDFRLGSADYHELGVRALSEGRTEKAIGYFKTACGLDDDCASYTALGCAYAEIHALDVSNAVLYVAMSKARSEDEEDGALWQLCSNALEQGDAEAAAYYLCCLGEDDSAVLDAAERSEEPGFRMAKKGDAEFYETQLYYANEALADNDLDGAMRAVEEMGDAPEPYRTPAQRIKTLCLFAKGDFDKVVALAEQMVREDPSLDNKATLATAYSVQERDEETDALLDEIMATEKLPVEIALKVMPMLIARVRDEDVLRAAETVSGSTRFKQFSEMYRAEALWNTGRHKEAVRAMSALNNIYGVYSPAGYYLKLFRDEPSRVPYGHDWPRSATLDFVNKVRGVCESENAAKIRDALAYDVEFNEAMRWVIYHAPDVVACPTLLCISRVTNHTVEKIFRDRLIGLDLTFDAMAIILDHLLGGGTSMQFDIVTQNRFKRVDFVLPRAYRVLPRHLHNAVYRAACDIVYTDETPSVYLERLAGIIDDMVTLQLGGNDIVWKHKNGKKIAMLRSEETMIGVLLARVYADDPDPDEDAMERYDLSERSYYKYKKIFFGDDGDYED